MTTCIILHNMIVVRARRDAMDDHDIRIVHTNPEDVPEQSTAALIGRLTETRDSEAYFTLQNDLVEYAWRAKGQAFDNF